MKRITYIAPHKTALTVSLVCAISSLVFIVPLMAMAMLFPGTDQNGQPIDAGFPLVMFLAMPVIYFVFGYLSTLFAAWCYNKIAKFTGGITYDTSE